MNENSIERKYQYIHRLVILRHKLFLHVKEKDENDKRKLCTGIIIHPKI